MLKLSLARVLILIRANQMYTMRIKIAPDDNHLTFMPVGRTRSRPVSPHTHIHTHADDIDIKATREEREESDVVIHIFDYLLNFLCRRVRTS